MTAAYVFRFELDYLLFDYDDTKEEYNFDFVFSNNDHIYMTVCDINTTQIGNIPIELIVLNSLEHKLIRKMFRS